MTGPAERIKPRTDRRGSEKGRKPGRLVLGSFRPAVMKGQAGSTHGLKPPGRCCRTPAEEGLTRFIGGGTWESEDGIHPNVWRDGQLRAMLALGAGRLLNL